MSFLKGISSPSYLPAQEMAEAIKSAIDRASSFPNCGDIEARLLHRLEDVLTAVFGEPSTQNETDWRWGSKGSLSVNMHSKRGAWYNYETKDGGGIFSLIATEWNLDVVKDRDELRDRAKKLLGKLPRRSGSFVKTSKELDRSKWTAAEAIDAFWKQGGELSDGHGKAYLISRGIDPDRLTNALVREAQHKSNKKSDTKSLPALILLFTDEKGDVVGIHAVRCPRGEKLPNAAKISNGRTKGAAIKFPGNTTEDGEIVVVEGPEDAMSIWQETGIETWAVCSVGNLSSAPVRSSQRIVVIGDSDNKTEELTKAACEELANRCAGVRLTYPSAEHKDPNAILMSEPAEAGKIFADLIDGATVIEGTHHPDDEDRTGVNFNPIGIDESFDPQSIPHRAWQANGLTMLGHMTVVVAPGAVGKSSFGIAMAVGVALGQADLIPGTDNVISGNVLLLNGEDDQDELERRLAGVLQEYDINPGQLSGKLYLQSFYGQTPRLAKYDKREDRVYRGDLFNDMLEFCLEHDIKLIVVDPLIGFHNVPENLNEAMEQVAAIIRALASQTGAAIVVMHHTRKTGGNSEAHAGDQESGRGASALIWASRIAKTLARMSKDTAKKLKIDWKVGIDLRRIDDAKANYARSNEDAVWFEMQSTRIANDETVPVPAAFDMSAVEANTEVEKEEEKIKALEGRRNEVGEALVKIANEGRQPQTDVGANLQPLLSLGRSAALDRLKAIPVGEDEAHVFFHLGHRYWLWRENVGSERAPRYTINWGPKPKKSERKSRRAGGIG